MKMERVVLLLSLCALACAVEPKKEVYVINAKPPSVSIVNTEKMQKLADIAIEARQPEKPGGKPLDWNPSSGLLGPENRNLYVLTHARSDLFGLHGEAQVSVMDLVERKVVGKLPVGRNVSGLWLSDDSRYLLSFSKGEAATRNTKQEDASVTVVNTKTNKISATLSAGRLGKAMLFSKDLSRIFVLSRADRPRDKKAPQIKAALTVFDISAEKPVAVIEFDQEPAQMGLSSDEKWLYLLDGGAPNRNASKHKDGQVHVVNAITGEKKATHSVGAAPRNLVVNKIRVGPGAGTSGDEEFGRKDVPAARPGCRPSSRHWDQSPVCTARRGIGWDVCGQRRRLAVPRR